MRSRASIKGHPIHPVLVPFPIGFLVGAVVFNTWGHLTENPSLWTTGWHLTIAGIVMALVAAVPGAVDYAGSVPPRSSGKKRATKHAIVNVSAVALFSLSLILRGSAANDPTAAFMLVQAIALTLLAAGGWMGGTLVNRNQISVDHRYAQAGKWSEARIDARPGEPVVVARSDDLKVDQMRLLHVNGERIVLGRTEQGYVAFSDRCPHKGGPLSDGVLMGGKVQCPWHGSQFDASNGALACGPATVYIKSYSVIEKKGEILLKLP